MAMREHLTITIGLGLLQAASAPPTSAPLAFVPAIGAVVSLTTLGVMLYRLGVWRQDMANAKQNVGSDVVRYREETGRNLERLERRLAAMDQFLAAAGEHRVAAERWQGRMETKLEAQERELRGAMDRVERLETRGA
jgi:hypothetical protein